ncbi:MAG: alkaline phosphatase PhoX [Streptomycetales bacterium]
MTELDRRTFLAGGAAAAAGGVLVGGPFQGLAAAAARDGGRADIAFRRLHPVPDLRDGEIRLHLPEGFAYRSFGPAGSPLDDGVVTPPAHDGMTAFPGASDNTILVRNHEVNGPVGAFGEPGLAYDPAAGGGTVTLEVTAFGEVVRSAVSLSGTQLNCSGGPMPWGSWITCEETVNGPDVGNDFTGQDNSLLHENHGYVYDVPSSGRAAGEPVRAAGRFAHESAAFDPFTGAVYLTEDNFGFASGFYRYLPPVDPMVAGRLLDGGRLQVLAVEGDPNARLDQGQRHRATYRVTWVDIDDPDPAFTGRPSNDTAVQAVGNEGRAKGAAIFSRLEGSAYDDGVVYFCSTQGGARSAGDEAPSGFGDGRGQVWAYHTRGQLLQLVYESPASQVLDLPDNVTVSRRGTLVLCENGGGFNFLRGLTRGGQIFDFARLVPPDDDPGAEFAGSTFGPDTRTLFVNVQSDAGRSFAIWGPWHRAGF